MAQETLQVDVKVNVREANAAVKTFSDNLAGIRGVGRVVNSALGSIKSAAGGLGGIFKTIQANWLAVLGAFLAVKKVITTFKEFIDAAQEKKKAVDTLRAAIENSGVAYDSVRGKIEATIEALKEKTGVADDEQIRALARLTAVLGDQDRALKALPAVLDAAAISGHNVAAVAGSMGKALSGATNSVNEAGIEFDEAATFGQRLAQVTAAIGGAAAAQADPLQRIALAMDDLKEAIGTVIVGSQGFANITDLIVKKFQGWTKAVNDNRTQIREFIKSGLLAAVDGFKILLNIVEIVIQSIAGLRVIFFGLMRAATEAIERILSGFAKLAEIAGFDELSKKAQFFSSVMNEAGNAVDEKLNAALEGMAGTAHAFDVVTEGADGLRKSIENAGIEAETTGQTFTRGMKRVSAETKKTNKDLEEFNKRLKETEIKRLQELSEFLGKIDFKEVFAGAADVSEVFTRFDEVSKVLSEAAARGLIDEAKFQEFNRKLSEEAEKALTGVRVKAALEVVQKVAAGDIGSTVGGAIGAAFGPVGAQIGGTLGGIAQQIGANGKEFADKIISSAEDFIIGLAEGIPIVVERLIAALPRLIAALAKAAIQGTVNTVKAVGAGLKGAFTSIFDKPKSDAERIAELFEEARMNAEGFNEAMREGIQDVADQFRIALGGEAEILPKQLKRAEAATFTGEIGGEQLEFTAESFRAVEESIQEFVGHVPEAEENIKSMARELNNLKAQQAQGVKVDKERIKSLEADIKAEKDFIKGTRKDFESLNELRDTSTEKGKAFQKAFEENISGIIKARQAEFEFEKRGLEEIGKIREDELRAAAEREGEQLKDAAKTAKKIRSDQFASDVQAVKDEFQAKRKAIKDQIPVKPEDFDKMRDGIRSAMEEWQDQLSTTQDRIRDVGGELERLQGVRKEAGGAFQAAAREVQFGAQGPLGTGAIEDLRAAFQGAAAGEDQVKAAEELKNALVERFQSAQKLSEEGIISSAQFGQIQGDVLKEIQAIQSQTVSEIDRLIATNEAQLAELQTQAGQLTAQIEQGNLQLSAMERQAVLIEEQTGAIEASLSALDESEGTRIEALKETLDVDLLKIDDDLTAALGMLDARLATDLAFIASETKTAIAALEQSNRIELAKLQALAAGEDVGKATTTAQAEELAKVLQALSGASSRQAGGTAPRDEFAFLHAGERVIPASRAGSESGGGGVMQMTFNIQALDPRSVKQIVEAEVIPILNKAMTQTNAGGLRENVKKAANGN